MYINSNNYAIMGFRYEIYREQTEVNKYYTFIYERE